MRRVRVEPPYRVHALGPTGHRRRLHAHGVVVEVAPGIEIEIDFAPHPVFTGELLLLTPPAARSAQVEEDGQLQTFIVSFGAANVLHVRVNRGALSPDRGPKVPARKSKK